MLEILAPAGNEECAKAAIINGADAIYLGLSAYSARQNAENFDLSALSKTIEYAHFCGVKVYVAMNTIVKDEETEGFLSALVDVWNCGADAIIMQDALLAKAIKRTYPEMVLHMSTQAGVCNEEGALFAKECGFSRVILARETPLSEIKKIASVIETEVFVQGALCACFSGQCYFSSFAGGNSGNRGRCKQPCRKKYSYNRNGSKEFSYALSPADLCIGEDIQKLIQAGVVSFKIEGRMRRKEYVAAAVRYYRAVLDGGDTVACLSDLKRTYNRGNYTKGLAFGQDKRFLSTLIQGHIGEKVGVVKVCNGKYFVESRFKPQTGDAFKILRNGYEVGGALFAKTEGKGFLLSAKSRLKNGDGVFITTDTAVNERVLKAEKCGKIKISLRFCENKPAWIEGEGICVQSKEILQSALSRPLTEEDLISCFSKTDGLPIQTEINVHLQGNIFIPKSTLNALRRTFYNLLAENVAKGERQPVTYTKISVTAPVGRNNKIAVIASDFENVQTDIAIYKPFNIATDLPTAFINGKFEKYLYYPAFVTAQDISWIERYVDKLDGIYAENYSGITFAKKHGLKVFAGTGLHLINKISLNELLNIENVTYYALSKEGRESELLPLIGEKAFTLTAGDIKIMDLCYCPFGKTCRECDKKEQYTLTDENGRVFPVRRYLTAESVCRFEVYNCASLVGEGVKNAGKLYDLSISNNKYSIVNASVEEMKKLFSAYTSGHNKRGVL